MSFNTATYAVETALLNYIFEVGYTFLKKSRSDFTTLDGRMVT
jgi:hypothetical protein